MKVLWFTNSSCGYSISNNPYNGGGWLESLRKAISKNADIELGIAFFSNESLPSNVIGGVHYYPLQRARITFWEKIKYKIIPNGKILKEKYMFPLWEDICIKPIADFQPDIIEFFGSESPYGLVASRTSIPTVLHVQGILNPYLNAFFPPAISETKYTFMDLNPFGIYDRYEQLRGWKAACMRELVIVDRVKNYIGRTEWDKSITKTINPCIQYFNGGEVLRDSFYKEYTRVIPRRLTIITTISAPLYKGYDMILKTACIIKKYIVADFEWKVFGNIDPRIVERSIGIKHEDVNIILEGVASEVELCESISNSTVYVHPSYIDNSPNSVCEAQMLGCSVIACNVGGVGSLIKDGETGFLVPANDPYMMASKIKDLYKNEELNKEIGVNARNDAQIRHNPKIIVESLIKTYNEIINGIL